MIPTAAPELSSITSSAGGRRFAVIVPVGPGAVELCRGLAVIASLIAWEPEVGWCVIIDDALSDRGLSQLSLFPATCRVITLLNPRLGRGIGYEGGLCCGVLTALSWIHQNTDADFVLKLDTDALVIDRFASTIRSILAATPNVGTLGVIWDSCNPTVRAMFDQQARSTVVSLADLFPAAPSPPNGLADFVTVPRFGRVPIKVLLAFDSIRPHICAAVRNGLAKNDFCQGGGYVISRLMIDRLAANGYLSEPDSWMNIPIGEDKAMSMYTRAVGLHVHDCIDTEHPFGVQNRALPYPIEELLDRRYAIIHSIKSDARYTEQEIRDYFQARRNTTAGNVTRVTARHVHQMDTAARPGI